jgi:hypothetical protein
MFNRIHKRLGTAGFIISIVALVAALGGGAYAASGGLTSKQKKEVTKIAQAEAKKFAGKQGSAGAQGPAGAAGAKGDTGAPGAAGANGVGTDGTNGTDGVSATTTTFTGTKGSCEEGGAEVKSATPAVLVCNGKKGAPGTSGFTKTLPTGETEKGMWSAFLEKENSGTESFSFVIPLAQAPTAVYVKQGDTTHASECPGSWEEPKAAAGDLCIYEAEGLTEEPGEVVPTAQGAVLVASNTGTTQETGFGSWAVTAE